MPPRHYQPFRSGIVALVSLSAALAHAGTTPELPPGRDVLALMERVADWQLSHPAAVEGADAEDSAHPSDFSPRGWVLGTCDAGMMALAEISPRPRYLDAMRAMAVRNDWRPGPRVFHADDLTVVQTYAELYRREPARADLAPSQARLDAILARPATASLAFVGEQRTNQWSWCDALFMAPPAFVRMWRATGNERYLDFAVAQWWRTSDYLYDPQEHLFFRDSTYFTRREANGAKVFWSRGNGWVFAGLARVLQVLPQDHPARPRFVRQFQEMAARLIAVQQPNGFWTSSLLDPADYPHEEESGTAFHTFGLAWGISAGLLARPSFLPPATKAWDALVGCVDPDGRVIHVQPIGADPRHFEPNSTEPFGVGGFLLAGREVYRLTAGQ